MVVFEPHNKPIEPAVVKPLDIIRAVNDTLPHSVVCNPDDLSEVNKLYDEYSRGNLSIGDVALKHGLSENTLRRRFHKFGFAIKTKGNRKTGKERTAQGRFKKSLGFDKKDVEKIYRDYMSKNGTSIKDIAIAYNIRPATLYGLFARYDFPPKKTRHYKNKKDWSYREICLLKNMVEDKCSSAEFCVSFPGRAIYEIQEKIKWMGMNYVIPAVIKEEYGLSSKNGDLISL